jgi:hypothetical protein
LLDLDTHLVDQDNSARFSNELTKADFDADGGEEPFEFDQDHGDKGFALSLTRPLLMVKSCLSSKKRQETERHAMIDDLRKQTSSSSSSSS